MKQIFCTCNNSLESTLKIYLISWSRYWRYIPESPHTQTDVLQPSSEPWGTFKNIVMIKNLIITLESKIKYFLILIWMRITRSTIFTTHWLWNHWLVDWLWNYWWLGSKWWWSNGREHHRSSRSCDCICDTYWRRYKMWITGSYNLIYANVCLRTNIYDHPLVFFIILFIYIS